MDNKTTAIVAHITLIGWIIALVVNSDKKDPLASFYVRQMLGLICLSFGLSLLTFIPLVNLLVLPVYLGLIVFWIISLINAANAKMQPLPIVGDMFQDWFKSIG